MLYRSDEAAVTTGFERGIPPGLAIGNLTSVEEPEAKFSNRLHLSGRLRPAAELDGLRFVMITTGPAKDGSR